MRTALGPNALDMSWLRDPNTPNSPTGNLELRGKDRNTRHFVAVGRAAVGSQRLEGGFEQAMVDAAHEVLDAQSVTRSATTRFGAPEDPGTLAAAALRHEQFLADQREDALALTSRPPGPGPSELQPVDPGAAAWAAQLSHWGMR